MIQIDQWQDDIAYIRGGGRVIEARRTRKKAVKAAKQILTEVGDDAGY